jgi:phospholipid/cholesterol/gamma-HCH transport system permease protein
MKCFDFLFNKIELLGSVVSQFLSRLGRGAIFYLKLVYYAILSTKRLSILLKQISFLGNRSVLIVSISGLFVGFVLGLQGFYTLSRYGSEQALGVLVALSVVRELGPVITALLYAGRAGTSLTAEIGLMRAGEQLVAMEVMGVDPVKRVLAPRLLAGIISVPILSILFCVVAVFGGYLIGVQMIGVDSGAFWSIMQGGVDFSDDILNGVIKSVVFGFAVNLIALYEGFHCAPTPEGVSLATTNGVICGSLSILMLDFILTSFMFV